MTDETDYARNQRTLSDWVKDFRIKKIKMKRKLRQGGADLRVCAILATALKSAEKELRQKQQERFNRWSELQSKLIQTKTEEYHAMEASKKIEEEKRRKEVSDLWKYEISSLDEFMRNMSSQRCRAAAS